MADERIDPFESLTPYALDHLARYCWVSQWLPEGRVLDAACGTGFGAQLLSADGKREILGVDNDEGAVSAARQRYGGSAVQFEVRDLLQAWPGQEGKFDAVVTFETLEHLPDPGLALKTMARCLRPGGLLLASVPGEGDREEDNPFHLQHFTRADLERLLKQLFSHVCFYSQEFCLTSQLHEDTASVSGPEQPVVHLDDVSGRGLQPVSGQRASLVVKDPGVGFPDTRLVIASNEPVTVPKGSYALESRDVWLGIHAELRALRRHVKVLEAHVGDLQKHNEAVQAHADDMQDKFTKTLGWGSYYQHLAREAGIDPEAKKG